MLITYQQYVAGQYLERLRYDKDKDWTQQMLLFLWKCYYVIIL